MSDERLPADPSEARFGEASEEASSLYRQVTALPIDERTPFLEDACRGKGELRKEVERLLDASDRVLERGEGHDVPSTMTALGRVTPARPPGAAHPIATPSPSFESAPPLGKFRILGSLGRGGMGMVYLAFDEGLKRKVALKVLPESFAGEEKAVKRFTREVEASARLRHRNIIPIYEAGEIEGTFYYSMEYVPGLTLGELVREMRAQRYTQRGVIYLQRVTEDGDQVLRLVTEPSGQAIGTPFKGDLGGERVITLPIRNYVREAIRLFAEVADALSYAHQEGVVHRDIKPSNLILAPDGRLMLGDFGLAKIGGDKSITQTGDVMGSPSYMSPEQTQGRRVPIDHRTDIWSLGVTLYEFLTLVHPFEAERVELTLKLITTHQPRAPRKINPRLPKDVETILLKTLDKDMGRRYPNARELADDLRSVLSYEAIQAKASGPLTRSVRFVQRHSTRVTVIALALALLVVGLIALVSIEGRERRELQAHFEYLRERMSSRRDPLLSDSSIVHLQDRLEAQMVRSGDLSTAIDVLGVQEINLIKDHLAARGQIDYLDDAMRSLATVRFIYHHNPSARERDRLQRLDRAHADVRVTLVWEIHRVLGEGVEDPLLYQRYWEWLRMFLGTRAWFLDMREVNPLVRINALEAMRQLDEPRLAHDLRSMLSEPRLDEQVQREIVNVLASDKEDEVPLHDLQLMASLLVGSPLDVDFLVRYRVAKAITRSSSREQFGEVLDLLRRDPNSVIRSMVESQ